MALWWAGSALAAGTGVLSVARSRPLFGLVYAIVAAGLAVLGEATRRRRRLADLVSLVGLGGQGIGAIGAAWELHDPDGNSPKARHLHDLGVNYRWALALNLAYSLTAFAVFAWALRRRRAQAG